MDHYTIDFSGEGPVFVVSGQTILQASLDAGIPHFHACGGNARCSTCRVLVLEGQQYLTPPTMEEMILSDTFSFLPRSRLACQTLITGNGVKLLRLIRDETDLEFFLGLPNNSNARIGEEKDLVLCFVDIRNSTQFVSSLLPFDSVHIMRKLFNSFNLIIEKFGGKIVETTGDGLYFVFGLNAEIRRAARNAMLAGFEMIRNTDSLNETYFSKYFGLNMKLGLSAHAGKVVVGQINIGKDLKFLVMGYPVNIAARLQSVTKEMNNNFIVSADTYRLLGRSIDECQEIILKLRGVKEEIAVYLIGQEY